MDTLKEIRYALRGMLRRSGFTVAAVLSLGIGIGVPTAIFTLIHLRGYLGRTFAPEDFAGGGQPVAVVAHRFWQFHLGSDPAAVGRDLILNGHPVRIVGVAPAGFNGSSPLALGARHWEVIAMVLAEVARIVGIGLLCGWLGAAAGSRLVASLLYGIRGADSLTCIVAAVLLALVALLASSVAARRSTQVDLVQVLEG